MKIADIVAKAVPAHYEAARKILEHLPKDQVMTSDELSEAAKVSLRQVQKDFSKHATLAGLTRIIISRRYWGPKANLDTLENLLNENR